MPPQERAGGKLQRGDLMPPASAPARKPRRPAKVAREAGAALKAAIAEQAFAPLARAALSADARHLAHDLIGKVLVRRIDGKVLAGRIVETEAYLPDDPASHSFRGETPRNRAMFQAPGTAYVYRIYGLYWCLNVAAGPEGEGAAVLLRALEPVCGLDLMRARRSGAPDRDILRGPGRLCQAMGVDDTLNGLDLTELGALFLAEGKAGGPIGQSTRIGLTKAADAVLRFYEQGSKFLSGTARLNV